MTAHRISTEPGYEEDGLISIVPDEDGEHIMYLGIGELRRDVRLDAQGLLDEDPIASRRFYFPVDGALQEMSVRAIRTEQSSDAYVRTYEVRPRTPGEPLFTFSISLWND